jgi:hypothetical protein
MNSSSPCAINFYKNGRFFVCHWEYSLDGIVSGMGTMKNRPGPRRDWKWPGRNTTALSQGAAILIAEEIKRASIKPPTPILLIIFTLIGRIIP